MGAQHSQFRIPDSLKNKNFEHYRMAMVSNKKNKAIIHLYGQSWLKKARTQDNWEQVSEAFRTIMFLGEKELLLPYADSLLQTAKIAGNRELLGKAYLTKGIIYYDRKEQDKALDAYLLAEDCLAAGNNVYAKFKLKYAIAQTKYYIGNYDEAIALFKECLAYYEVENDRAYLNSLHSLGLCYIMTGNLDLVDATSRLGLQKGKEFDVPEMQHYFRHSQGTVLYFKKQYAQSIVKFSEALPAIIEKGDFANETVANFYMAKSYWNLGLREKALMLFLKVDQAFANNGYSRQDVRETYETVIGYYKAKNDKDAQLHYFHRLLKVDDMLQKRFRYLANKVHAEYDGKKSRQENQMVKNSKASQSYVFASIIVMLIVLLLFLSYKHNKSLKNAKEKFEEMMADRPKTIPPTKVISIEELGITPDIVAGVLKSIASFEASKRYLEKELNLAKLAKILNTNSKYASKIIQYHSGKKSIQYISDLKVEYIVNKLKQENRYRNYTHEALALEAGFGSTQNFTKAFKLKNGMSPSFFIAELKKTHPIGNLA